MTSRDRFEPCGWTRLTVESIDSCQSTLPCASAWATSAAKIRSQVPSLLNRAWRFYSVFHGPNHSGTSRHGQPVRYRCTIPSITSW